MRHWLVILTLLAAWSYDESEILRYSTTPFRLKGADAGQNGPNPPFSCVDAMPTQSPPRMLYRPFIGSVFVHDTIAVFPSNHHAGKHLSHKLLFVIESVRADLPSICSGWFTKYTALRAESIEVFAHFLYMQHVPKLVKACDMALAVRTAAFLVLIRYAHKSII